MTVPSVYGSKEQRFNNAEILNRGVELELTGQGQVRSIGLNISSTVTFAYNKNKVQKLFYPSLYCHQLAYASDPSNGYFIEGKPVGAVYSYDYAGVRDGVPHVKTMDGNEWTFNDLTLHNRTLGLDKMYYGGTTIAPASFGWANSFSWKGLNLYVYMTGNFGGKFRAPTAESVPLANSKNTISKFITRLMESDGTGRLHVLSLGPLFALLARQCGGCFVHPFKRSHVELLPPGAVVALYPFAEGQSIRTGP